MPPPIPDRPAEFSAFHETLRGAPPDAMTASSEWTAHELAAHLVAALVEVTRHLDAYLAGNPLTATRSFDEREAPYRLLPYARLLDDCAAEEHRMRERAASILAGDPDARLAWTGRIMSVKSFGTHIRSECALHRWDLVGDDPTSHALLAQPELLTHAVTAIGAGPMTARGVAAGLASGPRWSGRLRTAGQPDLRVAVEDGIVALDLVDAAGEATLETDQPARLLVAWGRAPQPATRLRRHGSPADARRLLGLLAGY